jgi:4-diphosphocytidyl-2-C-methyl-D-erythritol kinase
MQLITTLKAPAKCNIFLNITGKRENGYHELQSLFILLDVYDEIEVFEHEVSSCDYEAIYIENDLITQTIKKLQPHRSKGGEVHFRVHKKIPLGSGLGGGSTDAAAALMFLDKYWGCKLSRKQQHEIALELGADVPFFLTGKNAIVEGIGEKVTPVDFGIDTYILVVHPGVVSSTRDVFTSFAQPFSKPIKNYKRWILGGRNQLQQSACDLTPEIAELVEMLENQAGCLCARMSGTGSSCFGIFTSMEKLEKAAEFIIAQTGYWCHHQELRI